MKNYQYNSNLYNDVKNSKDNYRTPKENLKSLGALVIVLILFLTGNYIFNFMPITNALLITVKMIGICIPGITIINFVRGVYHTYKRLLAVNNLDYLCEDINKENDLNLTSDNFKEAIYTYEYAMNKEYNKDDNITKDDSATLDTFYMLDNNQKLVVLRQMKEFVIENKVQTDEYTSLTLLEENDYDEEDKEVIKKLAIR